MKIVLLAALAGTALVASAADAAIDIYVSQSGTSVLAQTIGSFDVTGLTFDRAVGNAAQVKGYLGYIATGANGISGVRYTGLSGPDGFSGGTDATPFYVATSEAGDMFGMNLANSSVFVADGYKGTAIASTAMWASNTLASLDLVIGTYVFTAPHDTITVHIGEAAPVTAPAPEPATWAMMVGGFGVIGGAMRRRQRTQLRFA